MQLLKIWFVTFFTLLCHMTNLVSNFFRLKLLSKAKREAKLRVEISQIFEKDLTTDWSYDPRWLKCDKSDFQQLHFYVLTFCNYILCVKKDPLSDYSLMNGTGPSLRDILAPTRMPEMVKNAVSVRALLVSQRRFFFAMLSISFAAYFSNTVARRK